jgi:hypothetical protein
MDVKHSFADPHYFTQRYLNYFKHQNQLHLLCLRYRFREHFIGPSCKHLTLVAINLDVDGIGVSYQHFKLVDLIVIDLQFEY